MAEHEPCVGASNEWYTPPEIFEALGLVFDLDPCSPGPGHWVPAYTIYTRVDDGLARPWFGRVFVNPPFGGRHGHLPWIERFLDHGNGIAIVRAYTSAGWFHDLALRAETMLFPRGKTKFIRSDGTIGSQPGGGPAVRPLGHAARAVPTHCGPAPSRGCGSRAKRTWPGSWIRRRIPGAAWRTQGVVVLRPEDVRDELDPPGADQ
jgi:hypothetical protein